MMVEKEKKKGLKAYSGTISSMILTVVVLGILLIPFATANHVQKVRSGGGKYAFVETMYWDINDQEDFNNEPDDWSEDCGSGALGYDYDNGISGFSLNEISYEDNTLEGTIDGYGIGAVETCSYGSIDFSIVVIFLNLIKGDIIENDVTRIDIFLAITDTDGYIFDVLLVGAGELYLGEIKVNELNSIELTVDDLLEIYAFDEETSLALAFIPTDDPDEIVQPDSVLIFDMQMYNVDELIITSIDWVGIGMVGAGFFMMFCSVLMLPSIDFGGITKRLFGKKEGGE